MKMKSLFRLFRAGNNKLYKEAIQHYNSHEYGQAMEIFEKIIREGSSSKGLHYRLSHFYLGQAHLKLGILHFALGRYSKAVPQLEKAIKFNPDSIDLYEYLGICYNNVGDFQEAICTFEYFLDKKPNHMQTRLKLEITYHNSKMWERAISICKAILQKFPDYADVHFYLGLAYLGKGEASSAVLSFENALRINPEYRDAQIRLGITIAYLGDFDAALSHMSQMVEVFPKYADLHYYLGIIYAGRDELPRAIDCFRQALEINPSYKNARNKLGMILCKIGKFRDALNEFEQSQALGPKDDGLDIVVERVRQVVLSCPHHFQELPDIFKELFGEKGIIAQTIREFNEHLEIVPNFTDMLSIIKYFPDEDISIFENLIPVIKHYIGQKPHHSDLHNALGVFCVKAKRYDEGIKAFRRALEINPEYLKARFNLFKALKEDRDFESAVKEGEILLEKKLSYPDFYCSLGKIYIAMDMLDRAAATLQRGIEKNPEYAETHFLLSEIQKARVSKQRP